MILQSQNKMEQDYFPPGIPGINLNITLKTVQCVLQTLPVGTSLEKILRPPTNRVLLCDEPGTGLEENVHKRVVI